MDFIKIILQFIKKIIRKDKKVDIEIEVQMEDIPNIDEIFEGTRRLSTKIRLTN